MKATQMTLLPHCRCPVPPMYPRILCYISSHTRPIISPSFQYSESHSLCCPCWDSAETVETKIKRMSLLGSRCRQMIYCRPICRATVRTRPAVASNCALNARRHAFGEWEFCLGQYCRVALVCIKDAERGGKNTRWLSSSFLKWIRLFDVFFPAEAHVCRFF